MTETKRGIVALAFLVVFCTLAFGAAKNITKSKTWSITVPESISADSSLAESFTIGLGEINEYYRAVTGYVIIEGEATDALGMQANDTVAVALVTGYGDIFLDTLATTGAASRYCTLAVTAVNTADTVFKRDLRLQFYMFDSVLLDSGSVSFDYRIRTELNWR